MRQSRQDKCRNQSSSRQRDESQTLSFGLLMAAKRRLGRAFEMARQPVVVERGAV